MTLILGIDPGSRVTGYGLIKTDGRQHHYVECGCIRTESQQFSERLKTIFDGIREIVLNYQPAEISIEQVFMNKNVNAALKLGQARGAAIVAALVHTTVLAEYSPREIKLAVVGYGAAEKKQVQHMVCQLLHLSNSPSNDAADALAVAICHAHQRRIKALYKGQSR
jgi:crossover junction endodeoxyribonuclease RuvC